jgi:hypothetical protein
MTAEYERLQADARREPGANWKRWGPYLAERQWGTVREDYSPDSEPWFYFTHEQARSRTYRWGEDGLLGLTDRECRLCFGLSLWNGQDPILKERLFGLSGPEGNHGEDVKECYYYLDSSPTHSYMKALYKYPQSEYPYADLVRMNQLLSRIEPEYEITDTQLWKQNRYFDVFVEYAKHTSDDILIRIKIINRANTEASLSVLPTFWFRNTWSWGCTHDGCWSKPRIWADYNSPGIRADHESLGTMVLQADNVPGKPTPEWIFTENETNHELLGSGKNTSPYTKDAFHRYIVRGQKNAVNPKPVGTKAAPIYNLKIAGKGEVTLRLRMSNVAEIPHEAFGPEFDQIFEQRINECNEYYARIHPENCTPEEKAIQRQAYAGLLWTKQFFHFVTQEWLDGDPQGPAPPAIRKVGRNSDWRHLFNRDIMSMPDKWEYPWYAAWDSAFHMVPFSRIDPKFAKEQLLLFLREWYMHPNGQIPAYEWNFSDVNPPVHAWACWRTYQLSGQPGKRDKTFLMRVFQKLLMNFTWWVNRKDVRGQHVFSGGFLGLDNIGVFDRSKPLPTGGYLEQADGTAWMAFYCSSMMSIALELAEDHQAFGDMASKFFEHYIAIAAAMNSLDGMGLWDDEDGFYYDHLKVDGKSIPLKIRSIVGLIPLISVDILYDEVINKLPGFKKRTQWFLDNTKDITKYMTCMEKQDENGGSGLRLLSIPSPDRLPRLLKYLLDENEFLSPFGIRSLSKVHEKNPFVFNAGGEEHRVKYLPGESDSGMFGGNSNWRGPVWFPVNYLIIEALERYYKFYGDSMLVECPTGSGNMMNLHQVAMELRMRLVKLFLPDKKGNRPAHANSKFYAQDPNWKDLILFYEYFHGDNGEGLGASHQTGWTALVASLIHEIRQG